MDWPGCWRDNAFVKRLGRSVKHEQVCYELVFDDRAGLDRYFIFYDQRRPYEALGSPTPNAVYFSSLPPITAASSRGISLIPAA
jgi:putative transposase